MSSGKYDDKRGMPSGGVVPNHTSFDRGATLAEYGIVEGCCGPVPSHPLFTVAPQTMGAATKSAAEIVQQAADEIAQRAALRDQASGERSMKRTVDAFNGLLGRPALTEQEGWLFMCVLKMARATAGKHHLDDYTDLAGYAGLAGECGELQAANDSGEEVLKFNTYGKASNG